MSHPSAEAGGHLHAPASPPLPAAWQCHPHPGWHGHPGAHRFPALTSRAFLLWGLKQPTSSPVTMPLLFLLWPSRRWREDGGISSYRR